MKLTSEIVRELLDYDPETGAFAWKSRGREWFKEDRSYKLWNTRYAGKPAGGTHTGATGYPRIRVKLSGKLRLASHLAFLWMGKDLPDQVDHLDRDSLNNRWSNFAASTNAENSKNRSMSRANTSGVTGVSRNKWAGKWQAKVRLGGKNYHLGYFDDINDAAAAVSAFYAANGFTDGHGRELAGYASC